MPGPEPPVEAARPGSVGAPPAPQNADRKEPTGNNPARAGRQARCAPRRLIEAGNRFLAPRRR